MTPKNMKENFNNEYKRLPTTWYKVSAVLQTYQKNKPPKEIQKNNYPFEKKTEKENLQSLARFINNHTKRNKGTSLGIAIGNGEVPVFYPKNMPRMHLGDLYIPSNLEIAQENPPANPKDIKTTEDLKSDKNLKAYINPSQKNPFSSGLEAGGVICLKPAGSVSNHNLPKNRYKFFLN